METLSESRCSGGIQGVYRHASEACACDMTYGLFLPEEAAWGPVPVLWYLSGLTCTHENAMTKAGLQAHAAELGLALVFPDTSPRGPGVADDEAYDMGQGAGFYVDAAQAPWAPHFRMESYVTDELRAVVAGQVEATAHGITGHSMGGHGALTLAMRHPDLFESVSAFAPIANPSESDWGRGQLGGYLGEDADWAAHDAFKLVADRGWKADVLIDQGASDQFLDLLRPEALARALAAARVPHEMRMHAGYDHSYWFVSSFAADHAAWHAERLMG